MTRPESISKSDAIRMVAARLDGPVFLDDFTARVLAIWPSQAKDPASSVLWDIRQEHQGRDLLFLDDDTLLPIGPAMRGVCFRVPLSRKEVDKGRLFLYPAFEMLHPPGLPPDRFRFEDADGGNIAANLLGVKVKTESIFGIHENKHLAFDLGLWYRKNKVRWKDSLLVTILDWETGRYRLEVEPGRETKKHRDEIKNHNEAFVDLLFELLESAKSEHVPGWVAVPTAYLRLKYPAAVPADHWRTIVEADERLSWDGFEIRYPDWRSPLEDFLPEHLRRPAPNPVSKEAAARVNRFKAYLWHRKGLWRRIEIRGGQTLKDLDSILRTAFDHDSFDHLGGFWKLVRRGDTRRFREVDLGTVYPYGGEGDAEGVRIAELDLVPGESLKYVYDFGDWIEHRLELEAIEDPKNGADYPRITEQNKPRYKYCEMCEQEDRKTVATWICLTCSDEVEVLLCEDHLDDHDEDHYVEEMIY